MSAPAPRPDAAERLSTSGTATPPADPAAIRACLPAAARAAFDAEWDAVLDAAKRSHDLAGLQKMIAMWRVVGAQEHRAPGSYARVAAAADSIRHTRQAPPGSVPVQHVLERINARLAEPG